MSTTQRKSIPVGAKFYIYGWASDGTVIRTSRRLRLKTNDRRGSITLVTEPLGTTFPLTTKGAAAADAWSLRNNTAEGDRVAVMIDCEVQSHEGSN